MRPIEVERIKRRALAMRFAGRLAAVRELAPKLEREDGTPFRAIIPIPSLSKWGPIDMDCVLGTVDTILCNQGEPAVWPIDYACAIPNDDVINLFRMKSVTPKELRGKASIFSTKNVLTQSLSLRDDGVLVANHSVPASFIGGRWITSDRGITTFDRGGKGTRAADRVEWPIVIVGLGYALRHRYEWSAVFEFKNGISLRFGSSAQGCLELFKDRDKPDDGKRRSAILHWVRRHWRINGTIKPSEVRKHLRGITSFAWREMNVTIIPSEYDIEFAELENASLDEVA